MRDRKNKKGGREEKRYISNKRVVKCPGARRKRKGKRGLRGERSRESGSRRNDNDLMRGEGRGKLCLGLGWKTSTVDGVGRSWEEGKKAAN